MQNLRQATPRDPWGLSVHAVDDDPQVLNELGRRFSDHPDINFVISFKARYIVDAFMAKKREYIFDNIDDRSFGSFEYNDILRVFNTAVLQELVAAQGLDKELHRERFRREYFESRSVWPEEPDGDDAADAFVCCADRRDPDLVLRFALVPRFRRLLLRRIFCLCIWDIRSRVLALFRRARRRGLYGGAIGRS